MKELEQVIIRFNGSVLKVTDGTAMCNINDLTGDILTINVTRRRKSEGALIVKGRNLSKIKCMRLIDIRTNYFRTRSPPPSARCRRR